MAKPRALLLPALAALAPLAGCVEGSRPDADLAQQARAWLVGLSREQIIGCAGKPERIEGNAASEALVYSSSSGESSIVIGASGGPVQKSQHSCEVSFLMRDNWVVEVRYAGRTGNTLTPDEECAPIVRKCMNVR